MITGEKEEDLSSSSFKQTDSVDICHQSTPNFSIRNCVFASRNKGSGANNWPFCTKFLKMCLKSGIKDPLPPFDPPKLSPKCTISSHHKEISLFETNGEQILTPNLQKLAKICPVCKLFSSPSNTTLNAHIDQCLSEQCNINISNYSKRIGKFEGRIIKKNFKPRKKKSMVEIYANAKHSTIQDLDKRNGTNWAAELALDMLPRREKANFEEAQEEKMFTNGSLRNCEEGAVYVDSKGIKIRILSNFDDAVKKTERVEKKKRIGSKNLKFKKFKSCEKKHSKSMLLKIKDSKRSVGETNLENHMSKELSSSNFSKFAKKPLTNNSHFPKGTFAKSSSKRKLKEISPECKTSPDLEEELEKMLIPSRTFRKHRSAPKTIERIRKRENNIQSENNQCKERGEKNGLITELPLEEEVQMDTSLVPNIENSPKNVKNVGKEYVGTGTTIDSSTVTNSDSKESYRNFMENPEEIWKSTEIEANNPPIFHSCKDSNSKLHIGPRTNSPFTSYQSVKPNSNSNLSSNLQIVSPNSNSTVRLMGKDLTVNSKNQGDFSQNAPNQNHMFRQELMASENSIMSYKNNQIPLPYMMINPNFSSMQRPVPNYWMVGTNHVPVRINSTYGYFDIGSNQVFFHLNPNLYYSQNQF